MNHIKHISSQVTGAETWWRHSLSDSLLALAGVALVTGMIGVTHLYPRIPTILFVYLLIVLILACTRGLYASTLATLLAALSFTYFISLPDTFVGLESDDLINLWFFLAVAGIMSHLASILRRQVKKTRRRMNELHLQYKHAQELTAQHERQRIARELHDSVSQDLYGIGLGAHTAYEALKSNDIEQATTSIEYVLALTETGLAEMRALIFELRPESLETEGLEAALVRQVAVLQTRYKLNVETSLADEAALSLEGKHALYRIAQEALHNIIKHAHATTVVLRLARQENMAVLEVHDDGQGFDPTCPFPGHLGLRSMQERATKIGGTLTLESVAGQGTSLSVQVPLEVRSEISTFQNLHL
jgi:signal transduction histidine kinase